MSTKFSKPVPVLMYHSVGIPEKKWNWNYLTCPFELFEDQLRTLRKNGYESISLMQLHDYIFHSKPLPAKPVVFTFDDGYLDNWIFAYPLMKKYGFRGTIYVNPEFVDREGGVRKRFDENVQISSLPTTGFLSWDEMREMEKDGVMSVESHAMTHTWYPKSDKIIDYRHPGDKYIWMTWNNNPEIKYKLQTDDEALINYGEPVYEHEKSLSSKRFFPDNGLKEHLCNYVKENGGKGFFNNDNWKGILDQEAAKYKSVNRLNEYYETDEEYHSRIRWELTSSKSILEEKLNKKVLFHCWPGGSATKTGMEISDILGFKLSNVANDILDIRYKIENNDRYRINRINRFTPKIYWDGRSFIRYSDGPTLLMQIRSFTDKGTRGFISKGTLYLYKHYLKYFNHHTVEPRNI
ncbi:MAG TPA: hypothetical protein DDW27_12855 [Bacteroidales bacterium]|nr:hypothetical protein [Bacteroidales bacterium]